MQINVWAETDTGLKRDSNQDTFLIDEELKLFIVADGMGGHKGGEVASAMAVETVQAVVERAVDQGPVTDPRDLLLQAYSQASERIFEKSYDNDGELRGMGTTMVVLLFSGSRVLIGNVGDSRCYLYRSQEKWQLTEDHSLLMEHMRAGKMSEEEAMQALPKNVITRSVGYEREVIPDFLEREIRAGDTFLICSDGLSGMVSDLHILEAMNSYSAKDLPPQLTRMAKEGGGDDNVTTMVVQVSE